MLYFGLSNNGKSKESELKKITVELEKDITIVKGSRSTSDYKFWTKNYNNQFSILNASLTNGRHDAVESLKEGQVIDLLIKSSDFLKLSEGKKDIVVIGLTSSGNPLLTPDEFYYNRELYKIRTTIFSLFTGLILLLNGFMKIPQKINYSIIGIFIGVIIIMRILGTCLYANAK